MPQPLKSDSNPRYIAIGDIHGCLEPLVKLIDKLPDQGDLIFIGDYIDRGPKSMDVIDYLITLSKQRNTIFLKGNHESLLLDALADPDQLPLWMLNGGDTTLSSYGSLDAVMDRHQSFYDALQLYYETDDYLFVHGGIKPNIPLKNQTEQDLLWIRDAFIYAPTGLKQKVVFGHTPFDDVAIFDDKIGIDTGAVYGGPLSAILLPSETIVQVN